MKGKGFTLIELMICGLAIIGILAADSDTAVSELCRLERRWLMELTLASGAKTAIAEYHNTNGDIFSLKLDMTIDERHEALGIAATTELTGNYVEKMEAKRFGRLQVFFKPETDGAHSAIASKSF